VIAVLCVSFDLAIVFHVDPFLNAIIRVTNDERAACHVSKFGWRGEHKPERNYSTNRLTCGML